MKSTDWLKQAYEFAIANATDPSTQNGAIIVTPKNLTAFGANHFPRGVKELPERWERPGKYAYVEHAERNAIYAAAKMGISTAGSTMYVPWFACSDCARAIIQAGIVEVVGHDTPVHGEANPNWKESIAIALQMFEEAGVKTSYVSEPLGMQILFNGAKVQV